MCWKARSWSFTRRKSRGSRKRASSNRMQDLVIALACYAGALSIVRSSIFTFPCWDMCTRPLEDILVERSLSAAACKLYNFVWL
jgi:hypothetical protein